jgi:type IV secretory pathway VirJ component
MFISGIICVYLAVYEKFIKATMKGLKTMKWIFYFSVIILTYSNLAAQNVDFEKVYPLELSGEKGSKTELVIYLTGDGGWNDFSKNLSQEFEKQGYGVVTLNCRKYFWNEKSPEVLAHDIELLSEYFMKQWGKTSIIIVGYSFGADVASFLPSHLPVELKKKIKRIALLSPSASTDFVVKISDLFGENDTDKRKFKVLQEIEKSALPTICIFGEEEDLILKSFLRNDKEHTVYKLPGKHEYQNNYSKLVEKVFDF